MHAERSLLRGKSWCDRLLRYQAVFPCVDAAKHVSFAACAAAGAIVATASAKTPKICARTAYAIELDARFGIKIILIGFPAG